jgi:hypothetical protein
VTDPEPVAAAKVKNGALLVEMAAREAGRREHRPWNRASAKTLLAVLDELGFRIEVAP